MTSQLGLISCGPTSRAAALQGAANDERGIARVIELIEEGSQAQDSIKETIRRIGREFPHLTTEDFAEVARVHHETKIMEAAELTADAEASKQMVEIIMETERISGTAVPNLETALPILADRAAQGDQQAADLIEKFNQAALVMSLVRD
jgi:vacuolar-type H+-ATPase subunit D/Vma8